MSNSLSHHPLRNILLDCRSFMEKFEAMSIKHIYRKTNQCANALANVAPVLIGDSYVYCSIPSCITNVFYADLIEVVYLRTVNSKL